MVKNENNVAIETNTEIIFGLCLFAADHGVRVVVHRRQKWPKSVARDLGVADGGVLYVLGRILFHQNQKSRAGRGPQLAAATLHHRVHIGFLDRLRPRALGTDGRNIFRGGMSDNTS